MRDRLFFCKRREERRKAGFVFVSLLLSSSVRLSFRLLSLDLVLRRIRDIHATFTMSKSGAEMRRALQVYEEDVDLQEAMECNGISKEAFLNSHLTDHAHITILEIFLWSISSLRWVSHFTSLRKLQVIHQMVTKIEGFEALVNLEKLWLNENHIKKIQGLENCTQLRELYLYSNLIKKMEGLETLKQLKVLWLFDNKITEIEGVENLDNIQVLWLGRNKIETIGDRLESNTALEELNLAANNIGCFKEIPFLDRLPNLKSVLFSDPMFGENPVCSLCNYQTYALYHLTNITRLDGMHVTQDARHTAEATFVKKRMYYNMRIKTLKRNTTNILKKAQGYKQSRISEINLNLNVLLRMKKELEREIDEEKYLPCSREFDLAFSTGQGQALLVGNGDDDEGEDSEKDKEKEKELEKEREREREKEANNNNNNNNKKEFKEKDESESRALVNKYNIISSSIQDKYCEISRMENHFEEMKASITAISSHNMSRLLVELETGGNIRLEEGRIGDVWFHSCVDLVKSRFFPNDFGQFNIKDIRVNRVTRIHNRFLRNRFEDALDDLVDTSDPSYKRSLEYLFFGEHPDYPGELLRAIEDGFRTCDAYQKMKLHAAVPLSNSVSLVEAPRLNKAITAFKKGDIIPARLLITKVYLGRCAPETVNGNNASANTNTSGAVPKITPERYPNFDSVYRCGAFGVGGGYHPMRNADGSINTTNSSSLNSKQRTWMVFNNELILPEYLVELEYVREGDEELNASELQEVFNKLHPKSDADAMDIRAFAPKFIRFIHNCNSTVGDSEWCSSALSMPPIPKARSKIGNINDDVIRQISRTVFLDRITYLNLYGNNIKKMDSGFSSLIHLRVLVLSFNEIQKIEGIGELEQLERLELGFNLIKRVEGLRNLVALKSLELNNNLIYRLEDINVLKRYVANLTDLNLQSNAICEVKSYRYIVLRRLSNLTNLDGHLVTEKDRIAASEKLSVITNSLLLRHASMSRRFGWSLTLTPLTPHNAANPNLTTDQQKSLLARENVNGLQSPPKQQGLGEEISDGNINLNINMNMNSNGGMNNPNVEELLDSADDPFGNNNGMPTSSPNCVNILLSQVQELELNRLRLRKMHNLEKLVNCRRMSFVDNEITRIEGLEECSKLEEISFEENRIIKIEGFKNILNLRKLELGKNKITKIEGLDHLMNLTQLSLEDNELFTLGGIGRIVNLMELYIGNNKIKDIKEIHHLKENGKLIILDLSGNSMTKEPDYRLYSIFHLKKLKVLDGISIDSTEATKAKELFSGKITSEFLVEKIGHNVDLGNLLELNLSSCGIRKLSHLESFKRLLSLKCDHNLLS